MPTFRSLVGLHPRVGDEIAVKDFDLTVRRRPLDALIAEELTERNSTS